MVYWLKPNFVKKGLADLKTPFCNVMLTSQMLSRLFEAVIEFHFALSFVYVRACARACGPALISFTAPGAQQLMHTFSG